MRNCLQPVAARRELAVAHPPREVEAVQPRGVAAAETADGGVPGAGFPAPPPPWVEALAAVSHAACRREHREGGEIHILAFAAV